MEATLVRNGYNVERRKMYIENPRHNLRSSVELLWEKSLDNNSSNDYSRKKEVSAQLTKESYNKAIERKIEDELKINKSTFRVMPAPIQANRTIQARSNSNYYDSLNREIDQRQDKKNFFDSPVSNREQNNQNRQSLSKSVFGYEIDRTTFRNESYLSKILGDRLAPYLKKDEQSGIPRHQSFTINQPVPLQY